MVQKYYSDDLLNYCAIYEAQPQNAGNTRMLGMLFDNQLREVYATNDFNIVRS